MKKKQIAMEPHPKEELKHQARVGFATRGYAFDGTQYTLDEQRAIYAAYREWAQANGRMEEYDRFMAND